jgi:hypothetical protein
MSERFASEGHPLVVGDVLGLGECESWPKNGCAALAGRVISIMAKDSRSYCEETNWVLHRFLNGGYAVIASWFFKIPDIMCPTLHYSSFSAPLLLCFVRLGHVPGWLLQSTYADRTP